MYVCMYVCVYLERLAAAARLGGLLPEQVQKELLVSCRGVCMCVWVGLSRRQGGMYKLRA